MNDALATYRLMELRLWDVRWRTQGEESPEEEALLDEMDDAWMALSREEQALLKQEGSHCWPMDPTSSPPPVQPQD